MAKNENLHKAKQAKNDEFFTQLTDVEAELRHYASHFRDKIVFCNCNDGNTSAFWRYFHLNFAKLGLARLISTDMNNTQHAYRYDYSGGNDNDVSVCQMFPLEGNGDFRNCECIDLLEQADIVVTNPPFSLFREFVAQLVEYDKKFIIIGSMNAITYKEFFPLIKENKVWLGNSSPKKFLMPDKSQKEFGNIFWFTNLDFAKRHEPLLLIKEYTPEAYPKYDNYDAINVDKTKDIPRDYIGHIDVPLSFLDNYDPTKFVEIDGFKDMTERIVPILHDSSAETSGKLYVQRRDNEARIYVNGEKQEDVINLLKPNTGIGIMT